MTTTARKRLLLVGGGHAHVEVLRAFGQRPLPGLEIVLVEPQARMVYSGMLPGWIAGHYRRTEIEIDLIGLARYAGARWIRAAAAGLDADAARLTLDDGRTLAYDRLSLNSGAPPRPPAAASHVIAVKPTGPLLAAVDALAHETRAAPVAIVGGGAGGVELALALAHRCRNRPAPPRLALFTRSPALLTDHPQPVRRYLIRALTIAGITVHTGQAVVDTPPGALVTADGRRIAAERVIWAAGAEAPAWLAGSGLRRDDDGFVQVAATLRSSSHETVFAGGDLASTPAGAPRAGVTAVRQGRVLAANLRRSVQGRRLRRFDPPRHALALISTGDRRAVASRGLPIAPAGYWLWRIKDRIDRRFVARYNGLVESRGGPE